MGTGMKNPLPMWEEFWHRHTYDLELGVKEGIWEMEVGSRGDAPRTGPAGGCSPQKMKKFCKSQ